MSAAPALLRWIRSRHPGVSPRQRSSSAGVERGEEEVRAVMSGKLAGWPARLKPPRARLKPRLGIAARPATSRPFTGSAEPRVYPRLPRDHDPSRCLTTNHTFAG